MSATHTTPLPKPRNKTTYKPAPLPDEGFVRLPSVLAVLGISKTSFYAGIKKGRFPQGKLLSERCRVWNSQEIRNLLSQIENESAA
jgi:predicted DNA-binding transcriptional regulator AlpA